MWYVLPGGGIQYPLTIQRVKDILRANSRGEAVDELKPVDLSAGKNTEIEHAFVDVVGQVSLRSLEKTSKRNYEKNQREKDGNKPQQQRENRPQQNRPDNRPNQNRPQQDNRRPQQGPPQQGSGDRRNENRPKPNFQPKRPPQQGPPSGDKK